MTPITLETLPSDILVEILSCAESLRDLESLIVSSQSLYQAFQPYRYSITLSVVKNHMGPFKWQLLLATIHCSQHAPYSPESARREFRPERQVTDRRVDLDLDSDAMRPIQRQLCDGRPFPDPPDAAILGRLVRSPIFKALHGALGSHHEKHITKYTFKELPGLIEEEWNSDKDPNRERNLVLRISLSMLVWMFASPDWACWCHVYGQTPPLVGELQRLQ